jgi:hypothetical protein
MNTLNRSVRFWVDDLPDALHGPPKPIPKDEYNRTAVN